MNLRLVDLALTAELVFVRSGKGGKDRRAPVSDRAAHWLERHLVEVRPGWASDPDPGHVFVSRQRRPVST